jgi:hypothetical protein
MIAAVRRFFGSAWTHRAAAFLAVMMGGGWIGSTVRRLLDSESSHGLLGQTYLAGWLWRANVSLTVLYDEASLRAALAQIQPQGPILSAPWLQPPALAWLGWPLTAWSLQGARSIFLCAALALLLLGLVALGAGRRGGWNRTDWLLLSGWTLLSQGTLLALRDLEPTPVAFALSAGLVAAVEARRRALASLCAAALAPLSAVVWVVPLCLWMARRDREAAALAAAVAIGLLLSIVSFGWEPHGAFLGALASETALPQSAVPSLPAQLAAALDSPRWISWMFCASLLACALWVVRRMSPFADTLGRALPVSLGLLLGAALLPGALPSRSLLAVPALWAAGRIASAAEVSALRWVTLALPALLLLPWPGSWLAALGVGRGAPVLLGELGLAMWIWRAASDPRIRALGRNEEHPGARSLRPVRAG